MLTHNHVLGPLPRVGHRGQPQLRQPARSVRQRRPRVRGRRRERGRGSALGVGGGGREP